MHKTFQQRCNDEQNLMKMGEGRGQTVSQDPFSHFFAFQPAQTVREQGPCSARRRGGANLQLREPLLQRELHIRVIQQLLRERSASLLLGQARRVELRRALYHSADLEILRQSLRRLLVERCGIQSGAILRRTFVSARRAPAHTSACTRT